MDFSEEQRSASKLISLKLITDWSNRDLVSPLTEYLANLYVKNGKGKSVG
jgi:hypothetical protein